MNSSRTRQDQRRKEFKKGLDAKESRNRRQEQQVSIRKNKRQEQALKRRNISLTTPLSSPSPSSHSPLPSSFFTSPSPSSLLPFLEMVLSPDFSIIFQGTQVIRRVLSEAKDPDPPIDVVLGFDRVVGRLVALLDPVNSAPQVGIFFFFFFFFFFFLVLILLFVLFKKKIK